jgi:hypothetical protein
MRSSIGALIGLVKPHDLRHHPYMSRALIVKILLWYNVLSLGVWVGGTVYQMIVIVPIWSASPPESLRAFLSATPFLTNVRHFFGPPTMVLRVVPLFALLGAAWKYENVRPWIGACVATVVVGLVMTLAYVYPINDVLFDRAGGDLSPDGVRELATTWIFADRVRFTIMTAGYICLLRAFALPLASPVTCAPAPSVERAPLPQ